MKYVKCKHCRSFNQAYEEKGQVYKAPLCIQCLIDLHIFTPTCKNGRPSRIPHRIIFSTMNFI